MMYIFLKPYRVMFKFKLDAEYKMVKSAKKKKKNFLSITPSKTLQDSKLGSNCPGGFTSLVKNFYIQESNCTHMFTRSINKSQGQTLQKVEI